MKEELKTLKDIYEEEIKEGSIAKVLGQTYLKNQLKAEAIKWFKEDIERDHCIIPRTKTWMKRLNITEEDLCVKDEGGESE